MPDSCFDKFMSHYESKIIITLSSIISTFLNIKKTSFKLKLSEDKSLSWLDHGFQQFHMSVQKLHHINDTNFVSVNLLIFFLHTAQLLMMMFDHFFIIRL